MWLATSLVLQVVDAQQHQWGVWTTSVARGGDVNGNNDDHSVAMAALAEYLDLRRANPYGGRGEGSAPSLGLSPGQYASLFCNLPMAGDRLYQGGGGAMATTCKMVIKRLPWQ
jgi:hypothetical protein